MDIVTACLCMKDTPFCEFVKHSLQNTVAGLSLLNNISMGAVALETRAAWLVLLYLWCNSLLILCNSLLILCNSLQVE